jgi:hypothetical protein
MKKKRRVLLDLRTSILAFLGLFLVLGFFNLFQTTAQAQEEDAISSVYDIKFEDIMKI